MKPCDAVDGLPCRTWAGTCVGNYCWRGLPGPGVRCSQMPLKCRYANDCAKWMDEHPGKWQERHLDNVSDAKKDKADASARNKQKQLRIEI